MPGRIRVSAAVALGALLASAPVAAHPLGNFSVNRYAAIRIEPESVEVRYLVDMAEIPTFQEMQEWGLRAQADQPETMAYLARQGDALGRGLLVLVDGRPLALRVQSRQVQFPTGAADLPTMKIALVYRASLERAATGRLSYRDENFADRVGWREVVARAESGMILAASSVPDRDRSHELTDYPAELLSSPPQVASADIVFEGISTLPAAPEAFQGAAAAETPPTATASPVHRPSAVPAAALDAPRGEVTRRAPDAGAEGRRGVLRQAPLPDPAPAPVTSGNRPAAPANGAGPASEAARPAGFRSALTELMTRRDMGPGLLLFAMATAVVLGALHALEPGHGKTVVAAYLVGSRGTAWHAVVLGLTVTISHTAGVFLLGAVTLYASRYVMPDRLYPWLGALSGLAIAGVGLALLRQRWSGAPRGHHHDHAHPHDHGGEAHTHPHDHHQEAHTHPHHDHVPAGRTSVRSLLTLGLSGGIVPCPGALVVLLSALAWRRLGLGILLVVAFSVGLAAVLVGIGVLMVHARRFLGRLRDDGPLTTRWLPLASSAAVTVLGVLIAVQALAGGGILGFRLG